LNLRLSNLRRELLRRLPMWIAALVAIFFLLPNALSATFGAFTGTLNRISGYYQPQFIAPLFTREVDYWADDLSRWAGEYDLDPNLLATVMQIESCGHDAVSSVAGAQGLFQVMPFHFSADEVYIDPETNAMRGATFLKQCLGWSNGDAGLAMACYNGGPGVISQDIDDWFAETQRYYNWGTAIYADAQQNKATSDALVSWLDAGGSLLCAQASDALGF
jgi:soluble lytic murein transglycosylase-like protein